MNLTKLCLFISRVWAAYRSIILSTVTALCIPVAAACIDWPGSKSEIIGVAIVFAILLIIWLYLHWHETRKSPSFRVHDVVVSLIVVYSSRSAITVVAIAWFMVSTITGVVLPVVFGLNSKWIISTPGLLITINYTLAVPLLLWNYLMLTRAFFDTFGDVGTKSMEWKQKDWLESVQSHRIITGPTIRALLILVGGGFSAWVGISAATETLDGANCLATCYKTPWVYNEGESNGCELSAIGYMYYVVTRALNGYFAIGLIVLVFWLFIYCHFGLRNVNESKFIEGSADFRNAVRRLVRQLGLSALLGPTVLILHGVALFSYEESKSSQTREATGAISSMTMGQTGWIFWLVVSLFATCIIVGVLGWFYSKVSEGESHVIEQKVREIRISVGRGKGGFEYARVAEAGLRIRAFVRAQNPLGAISASFAIAMIAAAMQFAGLFWGLSK